MHVVHEASGRPPSEDEPSGAGSESLLPVLRDQLGLRVSDEAPTRPAPPRIYPKPRTADQLSACFVEERRSVGELVSCSKGLRLVELVAFKRSPLRGAANIEKTIRGPRGSSSE
jgi:hypothetical protein